MSCEDWQPAWLKMFTLWSDLATFLLFADWGGVLKLLTDQRYSVYPIDVLTEVVRSQEPNVSQNLQAWVVVLVKTLQHDKGVLTKYSN